VNKAVLVARRVARINPFLHVTILSEGVTPSNVASFLDGLDLLVEECDGLQLKYDLRLEAKARALNVIYAADERGFLSIEPYGYDPTLTPFHGLMPERPRLRSEYASSHEFMDALSLWLGGPDGISARSRASLVQIGTSLLGYPQLASEARFAAGQLGHVARRILLGERVAPFVGAIDLDLLLPPLG
jgi:molybdopterin/thiamine biosynthesis adenylyltransferase